MYRQCEVKIEESRALHVINVFGRVEIQLHSYFPSVLDGADWSVTHLPVYSSWKRFQHLSGKTLCGFQSRSARFELQISLPCRESNHDSSVVQSLT